MGSLANFQQNRGTGVAQLAAARKTGGIAPSTAADTKLFQMPGFNRLGSDLRFKSIVDSVEDDVSSEMAAGDAGGMMIPAWMQEGIKGKIGGEGTGSQFMELFVYAATKGNLSHLQTALRSQLRFYYIRLMLLGVAMEGELRESALPVVLREQTPKGMGDPALDQLVREVVAEIVRRDSGLLLELLDEHCGLEDGRPAPGPKSKLVQGAIGSTFNIFFNWVAVIVAGAKIAKTNKVPRQAVMQELLIEFDEYVVDHVLPLARSWAAGTADAAPDEEVGAMAELLKGLRDYINKSMCDIMIKVEAEANDTESTAVLRMLWSIHRKSVLDVWGQGMWTLDVGAPIACMRRKGSQTSRSGQEVKKPSEVVKLLSRQRVELELQVSASVRATPNFVEVTINISNLLCRVANASWDVAFMGHFPSHLSVTVTPLNAEALFSVNRSSANAAFKINMGEGIGLGVGLGVGNSVSTNLGVSAAVSSQMATSAKPWVFEQLEEGENGGSFNWSLTSWEGKPFDRINPMIASKKTSIFQFGRRPPSNPLLGLPFGSDGGILFAEEEYSEGLKWRFPKSLEGTVVGWRVEGSVDTTIVTTKSYWETRTLYFEHSLEQALIPDPDEPDKKDKKKKKKNK